MKPGSVTAALLLAAVLAAALIGLQQASTKNSSPALSFSADSQQSSIVDHTEMFERLGITRYEGAKTCYACHPEEVREVHSSIHYQMANRVDDIEGLTAPIYYGSKYVYNDYCGNIFYNGTVPVNWIGNVTLKVAPEGKSELVGRFIASGCSMCHGTSFGAVPKPEFTEEQLANIDCLACHSTVYKRGSLGLKEGWVVLVKTDGGYKYEPNPKIDVLELAKTITRKPTKESCLACHAFSGGGPHFKRPNIGPFLMGNVSRDIDVHLAAGLSCIDCHKFEDHKISTKSADTWAREGGITLQCSSCHPAKGEAPDEAASYVLPRHTSPVIGWILESIHVEKVACQTCHIPYIAKDERYPTDVRRDWSRSEFNEKLGRWEPVIELRAMVEPVYKWYNGETRKAYIYPSPVQPVDGKIVLAEPAGSREDEGSKIYPFKYHEAVVPYDPQAMMPVPVKVGVVFATGNVTKAAQLGAAAAGLTFKGDYVTLVRYMQVNHGVSPADDALSCFDCHGFWPTRMDWVELGYGHYPKIAAAAITAALVAVVAAIVWLIYRRARAK
jgi:hypothetical protein